MGLFDVFGSKEERERSTLRKLGQKLTERYGPPENRQRVIDQLAEIGTPAALSTLCMRFTVRCEVGISDDEEKERARQHLVEAGSAAVEPVKEFLDRQESGISWGLRVLAGLLPAEERLEMVLALLTKAGREYSRDPEKKLVLLTWLTEHHAPEAPAAERRAEPTPEEAAILPLLEDFSDDVRIAAVRALARLGVGEPGRDALLQLLVRDRENARVRGELFQALCDLGADVKGHRPAVEPLVLDPYFLDREGRVKKRG